MVFLVVLSIRLFFSCLLASSFPFATYPQQQKLPALLKQWHANIEVAKRSPDTSIVNLLNSISAEYAKQVSDSAYLFANIALAMSEQLNYPQGSANAYSNIAKMHYMQGDYDISLNAGVKALQLAIQYDDVDVQANVYNTLGLVYLAQKNKNYGREELEKAATLNKRLNNRHRLSANYFNIAIGYFETPDLDSAFYYLMQAEFISKQIADQYMLTMINNRLGDYYYERGQIDKAISLYMGILTHPNYQSDWENSYATTGLAKCYYKRGRYETALAYGEQGLQLARKNNTKWDIERSLAILHQIYLALGEYKKAYDYLLQDKQYSDSLFNENKEREIHVLTLSHKQIEHEVLVKQHEIAQQKHHVNRLIILVVVLVALFLGIVSVITYRNAVRKSKLNQILQKKSDDIASQKKVIEKQNLALNQLNNTKDQLFSIIGHDLRTPFSAIFSALELLKSKELQEEEKQFIFDKLAEQVAVTSTLLENLLFWSVNQQGGIHTKLAQVHLPTLINQVLETFITIANEKNITISHVHHEAAFVLADQDQVRIIFQNIVANAVKFTKKEGDITIDYQLTETTVGVSVKDNGIGIPNTRLDQLFTQSGNIVSTYGTKNEKGVGIGLMLVKEFADKNNARIQVVSKENEGTDFTIVFIRYSEKAATMENERRSAPMAGSN